MKAYSHLASLLISAALLAPLRVGAQNTSLLSYPEPADKWIKALPVGNGRLGAMVFGGTRHERLQLNDVTVWSGGPQTAADKADAYKSLPELRQLLAQGAYTRAEQFANAHFGSDTPYTSSYQTLGDLTIDSSLPADTISDYARSLDLSKAIARTRFRSGAATFTREVFSSAPAAAIVEELSADHPHSITFTLRLGRSAGAHTASIAADTIEMDGQTGPTLKFRALVRVRATGGAVRTNTDGSITVDHANRAEVILTSATNYTLNDSAGYVGGNLQAANDALEQASRKSFNALREEHIKEYQRYFDRVHLTLGESAGERSEPATSVPTDVRLKAYKSHPDPAFVELVYNYGRYLLISSSRPDNPLPANLQGIWGDGLDMPWLGRLSLEHQCPDELLGIGARRAERFGRSLDPLHPKPRDTWSPNRESILWAGHSGLGCRIHDQRVGLDLPGEGNPLGYLVWRKRLALSEPLGSLRL